MVFRHSRYEIKVNHRVQHTFLHVYVVVLRSRRTNKRRYTLVVCKVCSAISGLSPEPGRNQSQPGRNPSLRLIITPGHAPVYSIPCLLYKSLVTSHSDVASRAGIWFYLDFDLKSQILHIFRRTVTRTFAEVMFLS